MIVPDVNLFLYAYNRSSPHHVKASAWLTTVFSGAEMVGLPYQTIWAFMRISTDSGFRADVSPMEEAIAIVQQWMELRQVCLLAPGERHWSFSAADADRRTGAGPMTTDAQLAAITIEFGGVLHTTDRDFARFPVEMGKPAAGCLNLDSLESAFRSWRAVICPWRP